MSITISNTDRDPDELVDLETLIAEVIPNSEQWMDTPNERFGGQKPRELINTPREGLLRNLVRSIKNGMFS